MNTKPQSPSEYVIVYGPPSSGKTVNRLALKEHYKCDHVFDDKWDACRLGEATGRILILAQTDKVKRPRRLYRARETLYLTDVPRIPIREAAAALGARWVEPVPNYRPPASVEPAFELTGAELIALERCRQINEEKWTPQHDDEHVFGEMARAAACYAKMGQLLALDSWDFESCSAEAGLHWPWAREWWKPTPDAIGNLIKAGALAAAEIDRLKRQNTGK